MTYEDGIRIDRIARALAAHEATPFGEMTLNNIGDGAPVVVDTRKAYRREAARFLAMFRAASGEV